MGRTSTSYTILPNKHPSPHPLARAAPLPNPLQPAAAAELPRPPRPLVFSLPPLPPSRCFCERAEPPPRTPFSPRASYLRLRSTLAAPLIYTSASEKRAREGEGEGVEVYAAVDVWVGGCVRVPQRNQLPFAVRYKNFLYNPGVEDFAADEIARACGDSFIFPDGRAGLRGCFSARFMIMLTVG